VRSNSQAAYTHGGPLSEKIYGSGLTRLKVAGRLKYDSSLPVAPAYTERGLFLLCCALNTTPSALLFLSLELCDFPCETCRSVWLSAFYCVCQLRLENFQKFSFNNIQSHIFPFKYSSHTSRGLVAEKHYPRAGSNL